MGILEIIFLLAGVFFLFIMIYLFFLAIVSLWPERQKMKEFPPSVKFAIVIPAHNESKVIADTLNSLKELDYPGALMDVYVVADNCEDNTAEIVKKSGVTCWERKDTTLRGKGHVLRWAFDRLLSEGEHGAFVVIDADTLVDSKFLSNINQRLCNGAKAIQGYYDVLYPERSPMGGLSYLGFVLSRKFRYTGRSRLGWTSNLLGNGMCFSREVIQQFGWCATSIVEDIEYEMILLLNNIRVVFAPEAKVYAEIPETFKGSKVQRGRWDTGKFEIRNRYILKLLKNGFTKRELSYFDAAMELLIPPFSLFVILVLTGYSLFLLLIGLQGTNLNLFLWTSVISGLMLYIFSGLLIARTSLKIYLSLVYAPFFILWRLWVIIQGIIFARHKEWMKTERKNEMFLK